MILLLTHLDDWSALDLYARLRADHECTIVTHEALSFAARRSQRVNDQGTATTIQLADGTLVDDVNVDGVVNRLWSSPDLAWRRAPEAEHHYASAELHAFTLSWLSSLTCPVRNRPTPHCLAGPLPNPMVAAVHARRAGLEVVAGDHRTQPIDPTRRTQVVVLDGVPYGPSLPPDVLAGVLRFLRGLGVEQTLLGLDFIVDGRRWQFNGLTPLPTLPTDATFVRHVGALLSPVPAGAP